MDRRLLVGLIAVTGALLGWSGCSSTGGSPLDVSGGDAQDTAEWDGRIVLDAQDLSFLEQPFDFQVPDGWFPDGFPDAAPGEFGYPCRSGADCLSGHCVPYQDGMVCTQACLEDCPAGWECRMAGEAPDYVFICMPEIYRLCAPCKKDQDCASHGDLCVEVGEAGGLGTFCLMDCSDDETCPQGFSCVDIPVPGGESPARQCFPNTGSCICRPGLDGATQDCSRSNRQGTCHGKETCDGPRGWVDCDAPYPMAEKCDGLDNNCNGKFDEGFPYEDWNGTILKVADPCGTGVCAMGTVICKNGMEATCSSLGMSREEECNGLDDNCNGETDEGNVYCPSYSCVGDDSGYFEVGQSYCDKGKCTSDSSKACGTYTCRFGGDSGDLCALACVDDSTCIPAAHCREDSNECLPDLPAGAPCTKNSACLSAHCQNGFCCAQGDCCAQPADCPASYSLAPECHDPQHCQGRRMDVFCEASRCVSSPFIDDDSGCASGTIAQFCNPFQPVKCTGAAEQPYGVCPASCTGDLDCLPGYFCDGICHPKRANGQPCPHHSACLVEHCQNGFCCDAGDCCAAATNCPTASYSDPSTCISPSDCMGIRHEPECHNHRCRLGPAIADDSGCSGLEASGCGPYPSVLCGSGAVQVPPPCPTSCTGHDDCDLGAHCYQGVCRFNLNTGEFCQELGHCKQGLHCVDGVCCTSACNEGPCRRCNLAGMRGTCSFIPAGQDPDEECGVVDCSGHYYGWNGKSCLQRANLAAHMAHCNGAGSCDAPEIVCPGQPAGSSALTCHALCQSVSAGTCTGTVPPECENIENGQLSCGLGPCFNTVSRCVNGTVNTCTPLPNVTDESCNNTDDNCNGQVDDLTVDPDHLVEPNGNCFAATSVGTLQVGQSASATGSVYPSGDVDFFGVQTKEPTGPCVPNRPQPYSLTVRVTPATGQDCIPLKVLLWNQDCSSVLVSELQITNCQPAQLVHNYEGRCGTNDDKTFRISVEGLNGLFDCAPYQMVVNHD